MSTKDTELIYLTCNTSFVGYDSITGRLHKISNRLSYQFPLLFFPLIFLLIGSFN